MTDQKDNIQWSGKTGGTRGMQSSLTTIYHLIGLRPMYAIMALVVPFYMLLAHQGYLAAYRFFRQRMHWSPLKSFAHVYLNHFRFGQVILDRFAAYGGMKFQLNMDGYDRYQEMANGEEGFIMLSSHVGNYELAGYTLVSEKKPFNALVYGGETEVVMQNRQRVLNNNNIRLITVSDDLSYIFKINTALENGEILSMTGDRSLGSQKTERCQFFGSEAGFPQGPFALAAKRNARLLSVFVMKERWNSYHVYIREIKADATLKPRERMNALAQHFAQELEAAVRRHPNQWFNYYDFWEKS